MEAQNTPAIVRLVRHHGGASKVSQMLGGKPFYQEIQRWLGRGWASPMHILALKPLLLEGMTLEDLHADRETARPRAGKVAA